MSFKYSSHFVGIHLKDFSVLEIVSDYIYAFLTTPFWSGLICALVTLTGTISLPCTPPVPPPLLPIYQLGNRATRVPGSAYALYPINDSPETTLAPISILYTTLWDVIVDLGSETYNLCSLPPNLFHCLSLFRSLMRTILVLRICWLLGHLGSDYCGMTSKIIILCISLILVDVLFIHTLRISCKRALVASAYLNIHHKIGVFFSSSNLKVLKETTALGGRLSCLALQYELFSLREWAFNCLKICHQFTTVSEGKTRNFLISELPSTHSGKFFWETSY